MTRAEVLERMRTAFAPETAPFDVSADVSAREVPRNAGARCVACASAACT